MTGHARGFTLIELLIAMAVMVTFSGALLSLILAGQTLARIQPEAADVQQRARIALQTLGAELARAGAGLDRGALAGPLVRHFAPIGPSPDGGITIWYVTSRDGQSTLTAPLAPGATDALVAGGVFTAASTAIVFSAGGCRDVLRVDATTATVLQLRAALADLRLCGRRRDRRRERSGPTWSTPPRASCCGATKRPGSACPCSTTSPR